MKKRLYTAIALLLVLALAGCATQAMPAKLENAPKENGKIADPETNITNAPPVAEANTTQPKTTETVRISAEEAKAAALAHAGIAEAAVWDLEIDLEKERGTLYYEVSFDFGGYEYEYLVDITGGQIVRFEKEVDH